jgi:hypothetical protein
MVGEAYRSASIGYQVEIRTAKEGNAPIDAIAVVATYPSPRSLDCYPLQST